MDEKKKIKFKRVLAWIYLVLFVFVILNLMVFDFYKDIFLFAYILLIIIYFIIFRNTSSEKASKNDTENTNNTTIEK
ncbi:MAG TPA: hypothetical protein PL054_06840 [Clostridia bacterium]|jgi:L-asparagine transporter-like permease|nr:MAG: hypothetical protein BWX97_01899 [Firmicutes bacterium ADurb.Bin146]HOD93572.1 hypothetical protein [Clostridia bacterium]